jgi:hypothetical protein
MLVTNINRSRPKTIPKPKRNRGPAIWRAIGLPSEGAPESTADPEYKSNALAEREKHRSRGVSLTLGIKQSLESIY